MMLVEINPTFLLSLLKSWYIKVVHDVFPLVPVTPTNFSFPDGSL